MSQRDVFLDSEGDSYHRRNKDKLVRLDEMAANDHVLVSLSALPLEIESVLEVGCSNGWRLEALRRRYGARCCGVDPSSEAIAEGTGLFPGISLRTGTADRLPFDDSTFDLVIFGFCLYLCDREDLFRIASEGDRVSKGRAHVVVLDFFPPFAYRNEYGHHQGLYSFKMNYSGMFLWNPAYTLLSQVVFTHQGMAQLDDPNERISVAVLRKNTERAYPDSPFGS
jgi:ubiquinone/menaquinone biosynthesis C-methylase UbiE